MSLNAMHSLYAIAVNFVLEATILGKQGHGDERVCIQVCMVRFQKWIIIDHLLSSIWDKNLTCSLLKCPILFCRITPKNCDIRSTVTVFVIVISIILVNTMNKGICTNITAYMTTPYTACNYCLFIQYYRNLLVVSQFFVWVQNMLSLSALMLISLNGC